MNFIFRKKKAISFSLFSVILVAFAFYSYPSLICWGIKSYLASQTPINCSSVSFERIEFNSRGVQMHDLRLKLGSQGLLGDVAIADLGFCFRGAKKITIAQPKIAIKKSPQMAFQEESRDFISIDIPKPLKKWDISIEGGEIWLEDVNLPRFPHLCFSFENPLHEREGKFQMCIADQEPFLTSSFAWVQEEIKGQLEIKGAQIDWLAQTIAFFIPYHHLEEFLIHGNISGKFFFGTQYKGGISFDDFTCFHKNGSVRASCKNFAVKTYKKEGKYAALGKIDQGEISFAKQATGEKFAINDIEGSLGLNESFDLSGKILRDHSTVPFLFEGRTLIRKWPTYGLEGNLHFDEQSLQKIECGFWNDGLKKSFLDLHFEEISQTPLEILQDILHIFSPDLKNFAIRQGILNGRSTLIFDNMQLRALRIEELNGESLRIKDHQRNNDLYFQNIGFTGQIDLLREDLLEGIAGEVVVSNGCISKAQKNLVDDLQLEVSFANKQLHSSWAFFEAAGCSVHSSFGGDIDSPEIAFKIESTAENICHWLNFPITKEHRFMQMQGKLSKFRILDGDLQVFSAEEISESIQFQARLRQSSLFAMQNFDMHSLLESLSYEGTQISSLIYGDIIKYFLPETVVEGLIDFKGTLENGSLQMQWKTDNLHYESPFARLSNIVFESGQVSWAPAHALNVSVPFFSAKAFEKTYGFNFDTFSGNLHVQGDLLTLKEIVASSGNLHLLGSISHQKVGADSTLQIHTDSIHGDVESLLQFIKVFPQISRFPFGLRGEVISHQKGFWLKSHFSQDATETTWGMKFDLSHGSWIKDSHLSIKEVKCQIAYDSEDQIFDIKSLSGKLLTGNQEEFITYQVSAPLITAKLDAFSPEWNFDFRVESATYDVARIYGKMIKQGDFYSLLFKDNKSHFFGSSILLQTCQWDHKGLAALNVGGKLDSNGLYQQLRFFARTGLLPLPSLSLQKVLSIQPQGDLEYQLEYNRSAEIFYLNAKGRDLFSDANQKDLMIIAKRTGREWQLQNIQLGDLYIAGKIFKGKQFWDLSTLKCFWKNNRLALKEGNYDPKGRKLILHAESIHCHLGDFQRFCPDSFASYLDGDVDLHGQIKLDLSKGIQNPTMESNLHCSAKLFDSQFDVESLHPFFTFYTKESGWNVENCQIKASQSPEIYTKFSFDRLCYGPSGFSGSNVFFEIPPEMLSTICQKKIIPSITYSENAFQWKNFSFTWDNLTKARCDFVVSPSSATIHGHLEDGYYWFGERSIPLKNITFALNKQNLLLQLDSDIKNKEISWQMALHLDDEFSTKVQIFDKLRPEQRLKIEAEYREDQGINFRKIEGGFCGLETVFYPVASDEKQWQALKGHVKFHAEQIAPLLSEEFRKTIEKLKIGNGYELSGDIFVNQTDPSNSYFQGHLKGKKFGLLNCQFKTMLSKFYADKNTIKLQKLAISDRSMQLKVDHMLINHLGKGEWKMDLPELLIQDFRPSLLKQIGKKRSKLKPFYIQDLSFYQVKGILGDRMSFKGLGQMHFTNTFKTEYNLLDLPLEIISRLGLDMKLLIPVQGRLEYNIDQGRINLTKLKKCYSEGKRSNFYLSPTKFSYVDFEGRLNIHIRMKQYVLLKITELFTLSIRGDLEQPNFSLK